MSQCDVRYLETVMKFINVTLLALNVKMVLYEFLWFLLLTNIKMIFSYNIGTKIF